MNLLNTQFNMFVNNGTDELLVKSMNKSSKVLVLRTVTRNGKTFQQRYYVNPSDVKSTDKVIRGNQNPKEHIENKHFNNDNLIKVREIKDANEFIKIFNKARDSQPENKRWRVSPHTIKEYENCKMYATDAGSTFAIDEDGDIISVCTVWNSSDRGKQLIEKAKQLGGKKLDAYSGIFEFYTKCGLEPISWCYGDIKIFEEYVDGWNKSYGIEDVVFFRFSDNQNLVNQLEFKKWSKDVSASKEYDIAKKERDKLINKE